MSGKLLFLYLGDDEAYFRALQGEFRKHAKVPIDFQRLYESQETKIQSLFLNIFQRKPACVFVDFSKQTQDYLHLARLISRTPLEHSLLMVGLMDYLSPPQVLKESIATGAHLSFIKSAETFDVAFNVTKLVAPNAIGEHGFANASLKEEWDAGTICKIGYVTQDGLHIETDHQLSAGDRVVLDHYWLEKRVVPSRQMFVKQVSSSNMFYQFKANADLEFLFIDEFIPPEGFDPEQLTEKQSEREELIRYHKKQLKRWIDDNVAGSLEKRAKVLVVDNEFHFYQDQARTDKHSYTIRCIPFFNDINSELDRLNPQIIAFELQKGEHARNNMESLKQLISALSSRDAAITPFVIVFNTEYSSTDMQEFLQYNHTLAYTEALSPELLIKLADMLQKKMSAETSVGKDHIPKVFIKKNNLASVAEIVRTVNVMKLSETDMILSSEHNFVPGTNLHFTEPVEMFVHITPAKSNGKVPEYYGLIHAIGESEKKELRRYVNSIFFRDHDAQIQAESEEFKKLNDQKLQEKLEALKLLQEAEVKEVAEKAEESEES